MVTLAGADDLVRYHLGGMVYSCVQPINDPVQRVLRWHRACAGLGLVPLFLVHDLGLLLAYPAAAWRIELFPALPAGVDPAAWRALVNEAAQHPVVSKIRAWGLSDRTVGVLVARILTKAAPRLAALAQVGRHGAGDAAVEEALPGALLSVPEVVRAHRLGPQARGEDLLAGPILASIRAGLATLTPEDVQFIELFGGGGDGGGLDLQSLVDMVEFAGLSGQIENVLEDLLCLAPSILGTGRWRNEQHYPIAGVSGIGLRGSLDNIVPSEFALPQAVFFHRFCNGGLLYFGRERPRERHRNLLYMVANTGFSMAGDPEALTRVLGIALAKKMSLKGHDFAYSTFDEMLSPVLPLSSAADFRYFLTYRSERPTRERQVLEHLLLTLRRLRLEYDRITVLLITHLHFCDCDDRHAELFEAMRKEARLTGILIGSDLEIERSAREHERSHRDLTHYLEKRNVLSYAVLRDASRRRAEERKIVLDV